MAKRGAVRQIGWKRAEKLLGHRVDRRRAYAFDPKPDRGMSNVLQLCRWTDTCSGCGEERDFSMAAIGAGCSECGYTGKTRRSYWVPYVTEIRE